MTGLKSNIPPLKAFGILLDPRYKLDYLSWCLEDIYDKEVATSITTFVKFTLETLYKFYSKEIVEDKVLNDVGGPSRDVLDDKDTGQSSAKGVAANRVNLCKKQKREKANADSKSNVEKYLAEDPVEVEDENFDILA
ncbi:uncharacterized protein [Arachis hypogaea]|uniref:uncharacterized protein n=1 Tax=Arachis hypogaea TaxID=3818 RepID=UPI000DECA876|nr:uncharacterized protein LOC112708340 [Arachis hypogaea]